LQYNTSRHLSIWGENLDVLIIGAGAIGSLIAYRLGQAGHRVTAVARTPYVRAVNRRGLLVAENGHAFRARNIRAIEHTDALGTASYELVLITTKAFDTAVAAVQAQPFVRRGAHAMILQNGVGGIEVARGLLEPDMGEAGLYAGVVTIPVEVLKPAVIEPRWRRGGVGIAPIEAGRDAAPMVHLFAEIGFTVHAYRDWRACKWSKLMLNMLGNAMPAILDLPLDQVYASRELYELERTALQEARTVVRRMGIKPVSLPGYPVPPLVWILCALPAAWTHPIFRRAVLSGRGGKKPSLHIDLARGRTRSEVEFLNGAVVRAGEKLGLPTPVNRALCETLSDIVQHKIEWAEYQGQAERLIQRARNGRS
jgi:2-dehydropantoate 2-reductase